MNVEEDRLFSSSSYSFSLLLQISSGKTLDLPPSEGTYSAECSVHTDIELFYSFVAGKRDSLEF